VHQRTGARAIFLVQFAVYSAANGTSAETCACFSSGGKLRRLEYKRHLQQERRHGHNGSFERFFIRRGGRQRQRHLQENYIHVWCDARVACGLGDGAAMMSAVSSEKMRARRGAKQAAPLLTTSRMRSIL